MNFIRGLSPYPAAWSELVSPEGEVVVVKIDVYKRQGLYQSFRFRTHFP